MDSVRDDAGRGGASGEAVEVRDRSTFRRGDAQREREVVLVRAVAAAAAKSTQPSRDKKEREGPRTSVSMGCWQQAQLSLWWRSDCHLAQCGSTKGQSSILMGPRSGWSCPDSLKQRLPSTPSQRDEVSTWDTSGRGREGCMMGSAFRPPPRLGEAVLGLLPPWAAASVHQVRASWLKKRTWRWRLAQG